MATCAVCSCRNNRRKVKKYGLDIVFHEFPKHSHLRHAWQEFCDRGENWSPTNCSVICSSHFRQEDYQLQKSPLIRINNLRILTPTAIPSLVKSPIIKKDVRRKQDQERKLERIKQMYGENAGCSDDPEADTPEADDDPPCSIDDTGSQQTMINFVDVNDPLCLEQCASCEKKNMKIEELENEIIMLRRELEESKKMTKTNNSLKNYIDTAIQEAMVLKRKNGYLKIT
ncbi:THAP domain-containing protein 5-like [Anopheles nili]|uniref:THAP domain-containing protein 5-like n=1 Tax=Anopheles nili TaxID=185578 RepID=UPI00237BFA6C|nr:THAP domain-containing protein 5-like [Anopheles nili]